MGIKQLNATYLVNEDRILFRFNTENQEEYRFWFTRRVSLFLLSAISYLLSKKLEQLHSPDAAKAINQFQKEVILDGASSANPQAYESGIHYPIGFDPILVMDATCALTKDGQKLAQLSDIKDGEIDNDLSVDFVLPGGANINLKLSPGTLNAMYVLLDQLRHQASWGDAVLDNKPAQSGSSIEDLASEVKTSKNLSIH